MAGSGTALFWRRYLKSPRSVGGTPSSRALARAMVAGLDLKGGETVVEIGPGTGPFTRALAAAGVPPAALVLVEFDAAFARHLAAEFPAARVVNEDARNLPEILARLGVGPVSKMLSGLPFRSLPAETGAAIAHAIGQSLAPGGVCVQFSYFTIPPFPPAVARAHHLSVARPKPVFANLPPAFVWTYRKSADGTSAP